MKRWRRGVALIALSATCGLLGAVVYHELRGLWNEASAVEIARQDRALDTPEPVVWLGLPPPTDFAGIAERPLFFSSRRPPVPPPQPAPQVARPEPPDVVLTGTVLSASEKFALVRFAGSPELSRVAEGAQIKGWRVEEVLPMRVVLTSGDLRHEVFLVDPKKLGREPTAAQPSARELARQKRERSAQGTP